MNSWQNVYHSENEYRAKIVRDILDESGLSPVILNKKDRSLNDFGGFDVVVKPEEVMEALKIIEDEIHFE